VDLNLKMAVWRSNHSTTAPDIVLKKQDNRECFICVGLSSSGDARRCIGNQRTTRKWRNCYHASFPPTTFCVWPANIT